ncbi:hypothetical protein [Aulosira sp. FACHB-615]|uniref:hypothetical protein n=1 Tax=Aulosira sp. FACHB-615 TaxID=2692777 RepID=UPI001686A928|nr:hypothetical protein [Aulosira sp. FACHB-615]MBD2492535.1 hypothetical protein [Aulosira sp. FACHB-615]
MRSLLKDGETLSDKVREAIAVYLSEQKALDLLEEIINDAVSAEETLPPHSEYIVSGELIGKAAEIVYKDAQES